MSAGDGPANLSPIANLQQQWSPVIADVGARCQGDPAAGQRLEPFLDQLEGQEDWRRLAAVLRRVLAGERDGAALLVGLDQTDTVILSNVLQRLGVDVRALVVPFIDLAAPPAAGEGRLDLDLGEFIALVAYASRAEANPEVVARCRTACAALASDPDGEPALRNLGAALGALLDGAAEPDLTALPAELAALVRQLLQTVREA